MWALVIVELEVFFESCFELFHIFVAFEIHILIFDRARERACSPLQFQRLAQSRVNRDRVVLGGMVHLASLHLPFGLRAQEFAGCPVRVRSLAVWPNK